MYLTFRYGPPLKNSLKGWVILSLSIDLIGSYLLVSASMNIYIIYINTSHHHRVTFCIRSPPHLPVDVMFRDDLFQMQSSAEPAVERFNSSFSSLCSVQALEVSSSTLEIRKNICQKCRREYLDPSNFPCPLVSDHQAFSLTPESTKTSSGPEWDDP